MEKQELVQAVLAAHGGESGSTCTVCLGTYESGDQLRVLPCGHRYHVSCVDRCPVQTRLLSLNPTLIPTNQGCQTQA